MSASRPFLTKVVDCLVAIVSWICSPIINRATASWDIQHVRQVEFNTEAIGELKDELTDIQRRIRRLEEIRRLRERGRSGGGIEQSTT